MSTPRTTVNRTPLHRAAENGRIDLTRLLIDKGADLNAQDNRQQTPLHCAAEKGHTDPARLLIEKGPDLKRPRTKWQWTPLHWAAWEGPYRHRSVAD